jgi:hypothetical protein
MEQATHDKVNLVRLVHKLDESTAAETFSGHERPLTWLAVQTTLQVYAISPF